MANLLEKIFRVGKVLQAGESLQDPARWKNVQNSMNALVIIIGSIPMYVDLPMDEHQINAIAYGAATLLSVINVFFTTATSDKIGLPNKK